MRKDVVGSDKLCLGAWKEGVPNIFIPALSKKLQIFPRSKNLPIPYPSNKLWNMEDSQSILKGKPIKKLTSPRAGASHAALLDGPNVTCSSHNIKRERERERRTSPRSVHGAAAVRPAGGRRRHLQGPHRHRYVTRRHSRPPAASSSIRRPLAHFAPPISLQPCRRRPCRSSTSSSSSTRRPTNPRSCSVYYSFPCCFNIIRRLMLCVTTLLPSNPCSLSKERPFHY
jgi:hypothetical protein